MLAQTVYFYNEKEEIIKELHDEEYEDLSKDEFKEMIIKLDASIVKMKSFYHNHHAGEETILYEKKKRI